VRSLLVIGYGNDLRGDDGIGVAVADKLSETVLKDGVRILTCQQLTPELASEISKMDRVILIDAAQGSTPGKATVSRIEPDKDGATFTHELQPSTLLSCCLGLYGVCPETFLVSIVGSSFDFSDKLSDALTRSMPQLVRFVREFIDQ